MQGEGYQPAAEVLERLKQVDFVAIVGPTAAGKSTLLGHARALDADLHEVMNNTSRPPRAGEKDGVDFIFRTRAEMLAGMQERAFAQVMVHPSGDLYATEGTAYSSEGISLLPVLAAVVPVFRGLPFKRMRVVYILPPSWEALQIRIDAHAFTPEQRTGRMREARDSLMYACNDPAVLFVINDTIELATERLIRLIKFDETDVAEQGDARSLARELLRHLNT